MHTVAQQGGIMRYEIRDLLESLVDEVKLNEESKDDIIHEYVRRILDLVADEEPNSFLPEEDAPYID